ncbi:MAG: C40 family peptidase, partial [Candidatus Methylumidiphilus sp.]
ALLSGCATTPKPASPPRAAGLLEYALSLQGTPYAWGKSSPEEGFDCSGFVWHVYRHEYGVTLPRTAEQMALGLPEVDPEDRQPGDLLLFNTGGKFYSHVALYLGSDAFVHASSAKTEVIVSNLGKPYWRERLVGVRRPPLSNGPS